MKVICYIDESDDMNGAALALKTSMEYEESRIGAVAFHSWGCYFWQKNPSGSITIRKEGATFEPIKRSKRCKKTADMFDGQMVAQEI